jgi:AraC-like DNA-binding protein
VDVLSDAVTAMRTGQPHSGRVRRPVPFGMRNPPVAGAGFHIVLQGSCWLFPPDGPPADISTDGSAAATVMLCGAYLLDRSRTHPLLDDLPEVIHLPARVGHHPGLRAAVDLLGGELEQPRPGSDAMLPALLDVLLLHILRAWFDEQSAHGVATGWAAALRDPAVAAGLRAIHSDPGRPWTVAELASHAGLSRAAFARRFAALVGQPPQAYLTWWRLTLAARLLHDTDAPLATVARMVGYTSEFAFAHAFKRELGLAPGGFRRIRPSANIV